MPTIGAIGPKVSCGRPRSSRAARRRARSAASRGAVGKPSARLPPVTTRRAALDRVGHVAVHLGGAGLVVHRAHRGGVVERVAEPHLALDLAGEQLDELVAHRARARAGARPPSSSGRRRGRRPRGRPRRRPRGRRPPSPRTARCRPSRAAAPCRRRAWRRSGRSSVEPVNATARVPGLAASSSPTSGPGPSTMLKTPGGRSASATHSASTPGADRGRRRRRPDDAVAAGQRGRQHLGGHRVGPVPGRDQADARRAGGAAAARAGRARRSPGSCPQALAVLGGHAEELDQLADLALGLRLERLALVEREHAGQLVAAALAGVGRAVQQLGALEPGARRPGRERGVGGGDRPPGVRRGRPRPPGRATRRWRGWWPRRSRRSRRRTTRRR